MKLILFLALLLFGTAAFGQKFDYIWVTGDDNQTFDTTYGGGLLDFNFSPPKASYHYREHNMFTTNSSICDSVGNLLFYTNGCVIAGADDEVLENGYDINPGDSHTLWCDTYNDGYSAGIQSSIILPLPDTSNIFYLFHKRTRLINNPVYVYSDNLYYSIVKIAEPHTLGKSKVTEKNIVLMSDTLSLGEIVATKHANGKDWWVVTPKRNSNLFYTFLLTMSGITDTIVQTIGHLPTTQAEGGIQSCFSPDGSQYFRAIPSASVMRYEFDRTNGIFTNFDTIHVNYANWPSITNGCAVSPNGRFLYVSAELNVFQFDLWASDISASQVTVAEWDGFHDPVGTVFGACQLGPDCKIYISTIDARYYHVINNPDEPGLDCDVAQHSLTFPTPTGASMPSFPNYRLGPIDNPGVPCTATVAVNQPVLPIPSKPLWVFPNPANDALSIDYRGMGGHGGQFLMFNAQGQSVRQITLPPNQDIVQLNLSGLPGGIYWYAVPGVTEGKVSIQH